MIRTRGCYVNRATVKPDKSTPWAYIAVNEYNLCPPLPAESHGRHDYLEKKERNAKLIADYDTMTEGTEIGKCRILAERHGTTAGVVSGIVYRRQQKSKEPTSDQLMPQG